MAWGREERLILFSTTHNETPGSAVLLEPHRYPNHIHAVDREAYPGLLELCLYGLYRRGDDSVSRVELLADF